jgi:putative ABC transport system ATP-binding protein
MTLFTLEAVTFRALRALDATIPVGASCIWGPSGSGKSTLLRLLNRLADPEQGRVLFEGEDVRGLDPLQLRRRAVLVHQLPTPLPGTVAENVRYGSSLAGNEVDVERMLEHVGLPARLGERKAASLSVGEQQRVMLARALALEPGVLLLDEPTSALDERARDHVEATLRHLCSDLGVSLVVVTHDRGQAERLAESYVELRAAA